MSDSLAYMDVMTDTLDREAESLDTSLRGKLLDGILEAQQGSATLLAGSRIVESARALVAFAQLRGCPVLVPVSSMANRLVGAALVIDPGTLRATDDGSVPTGEHVILVEAVAADTAGLRDASEMLLSLGAASVECVALQLLSEVGAYGVDVHVLLTDEPLLRIAR